MLAVFAYVAHSRSKAKTQARQSSTLNETVPVSAPHDISPVSSLQRDPSQDLEIAQEAAPAASAFNRRQIILLSIALLIPVYFETLDYTVVATAQTHIASAFNRLDLQSWIGTAYLLSSTVFLPVFASIGDVWGRHWALQAALVFFMVGSAISTGANSMVTMLVGRGIAGIGAAGLQALVRIIMSDSASLDANNWQQSMLFFLFTIGYCTGPIIGGALLTVSFRWIFAINDGTDVDSLPACAVAVVLAFFILRTRAKGPQSTASEPETFFQKMLRIDWIGAVLSMGGGILILLALSEGPISGWDTTRVIVWFVIGGIAYIAFLIFEWFLQRRSSASTEADAKRGLLRTQPMLPLTVFRSLNICVTMAATFVSGMVMLVMFYFVSIFMTIVAGHTATSAGIALLYFAPGLGAGSLTQIFLIKRLRQPRIPIILGSILITVSLGLVSMAVDRNNDSMIDGFMVVSGAGVGMSIGALAVQARFSQPADKVAIVSALSLFFRALGGTVGLAQCGAVLNGKVASYITSLLRSGTLSAATANSLSQASSSSLSSLQSINALPQEVQQIVKDAFRDGTRWAFISLIPWAALACIGTFFLSNIRDSDQKPSTVLGDLSNEKDPKQPSEDAAAA
ncbi:hypothetical protein IEO21_04691 [Rhodonia placenta]|uniref:Major facilitator superfamily (MFS) profile domain-containing protein n=1 Tax=Rhodonia placenta TaxID=104341 RepID=A0A8H7P3D2_9APHY|nr:hypothetical protein IEO21_04691 [Postia placenta]